MAVTFTGAGTAQNATSQTSVAVTTATSFAVGDILVALMAYDNSGGGGADPMSGTISLSGGYTGASVSAQTGHNDPGAASAGLAARCVAFPVTTTIPTSTSITVSWTGNAVAKAVVFMKVSSTAVTGYRTNNGATGVIASNVNVANAAPLVTPSVTIDEGVLCWACEENGIALTGDADTTNGTWGSIYGTFNNTTAGVGGMAAYMQAKVVTATATQTFNPTGNATASDWITGCLIFTETPVPAITQAAYQLYDDGVESTSPALAAQNTAANGDIIAGDGIGQVRVRLQSTNAGTINATDDWQLQWEKNANGSWADVTAASSTVKGYLSGFITEGQATNRRLTVGTGSYVAGKSSEDGLVDNFGWSSNNYTELMYMVAIVKADVVAGDVIRFRVLRNGSTTGMTYTAVPTVNVVESTISQAAYRIYADGSETGSTALAAQDTAPSVDVTSGDVNAQVRMRLQSTGGAAIPATDDFQLQLERNTSGVWNDVTSSTAEVLVDSYSTHNSNSIMVNATEARGQSFIANGTKNLSKARFYLNKVGTPPGNVGAILANHTGTFGVPLDGTGVEPVLTTSTLRAATSIGSSVTLEEFVFDRTQIMVNGTPYVIAVFRDTTDGTNHIIFRSDTAGTHAGCRQSRSGVSWSSSSADGAFEVYGVPVLGTCSPYASPNTTDGAATTNRLGVGTGTFVAGKISEDGLADDVGWSSGNYTELLYSVTLKQVDLINGDTLRFRILRNGLTTGTTFTQYPTINITSSVVAETPAIIPIMATRIPS